MMDSMMSQMMQPFGGGGGAFGGGQFGGGLFGQMGQMMESMARNGGAPGGCSSFACQSVSFSSSVGADGRVHQEHFASSTVADGRRNVRESKQAYSNTSTGMQKLALERRIADQGRRVVQEHCAATGEERRTDTLRGLTEDQAEGFSERWQQEAAPHLPAHSISTRFMLGNNAGGAEEQEEEEDARAWDEGGHAASSNGYEAEESGFRPQRGCNAPERRGRPGRHAGAGCLGDAATASEADAPHGNRRWRIGPY
mmetsp:Transcript_49209/g.110780  ORF Transcript_49209/g.110780 Transcript_49209/m.110780 type:complete len:254 (+) Transcript_49209:1-762(+)